eukprot:3600002-Amphidinium_carterae.2
MAGQLMSTLCCALLTHSERTARWQLEQSPSPAIHDILTHTQNNDGERPGVAYTKLSKISTISESKLLCLIS